MENFDMISCFWVIMTQSVELIVPVIGVYLVMDLLGSILFKK